VIEVRPIEVLVPDKLWQNHSLLDGAKLLWCYFVAVIGAGKGQFAYAELRKAMRISQNSLIKYLGQLQQHGWLQYEKTGLRRVTVKLYQLVEAGALRVPSDLLFEPDLPRGAIWVWSLILRENGKPLSFKDLQRMTGYTQPTLSKYLRILREREWLVGSHRRVNRFMEFHLQASNPHQVKRQAQIKELEQVIEKAKYREGYSQGQCIAARMLMLALEQGSVIENAELAGLENPLTGGKMHVDMLIPQFNFAIEFQGPQHDGPTKRYPDPEEYKSRRVRDLVKRGLAAEQGITLISIRPADLSFQRIRELVSPFVPLKKDLSDRWHLIEYLERRAAEYRRKAVSDSADRIRPA